MLGTGELEEVFFLIINRVNGNGHAFLAFEQGTVLVPLYYSALGRNGMAMRVMSRFSQKLVQSLNLNTCKLCAKHNIKIDIWN